MAKRPRFLGALLLLALLLGGCGSAGSDLQGTAATSAASAGAPPGPPGNPGTFPYGGTAKASEVSAQANVGPLTVQLNPGWNGVALQGQTVTAVNSSAGVAGFAFYDGANYQLRTVNMADLNAEGGGRRGLWVFATAAGAFTYSAGDDGQGHQVNLKPGYNLVSFASPNTINGGTLAAKVNGLVTPITSIVLPQFTQIESNNTYTTVDISQGGVLQPGRPYWLFSTAVAQLNWVDPTPSPSPGGNLTFKVQPATVASNTNFAASVQVQVSDTNGNVVPNANNPITLALGNNPSSATLLGTLTVAANNGVATFPDLKISKGGAGYTLVATSTGLAQATSGAFNVTSSLSFANPAIYPIDAGNGGSTNPENVILADLNKDGKLDVAVANQGSNTVSVRLNLGNGTFGAESKFTTANDGPVAVVAADFDADSNVDLGVATSAKLSFLKNDGTGKFPNHVDFNAGTGARGMDRADVDGDGDQDVVISDFGADAVVVMTNNGAATFAAKSYPGGAKVSGQRGIRCADLNGDNKPDLVLAMFGAGFGCVTWINTGTVGALFPQANANKSLPASSASAAAMMVAVGDLDKDGDIDVAVPYIDGLNSKAQVYLNNGTGTFVVGQAITCSPDPFGAAMADLNADGFPDFISGSAFGVNNNGTGEADVFLGKGDGTLNAQVAFKVTNNDNVRSLAVGDLDGNNLPDMVTSPAQLNVFLNTSN